jgi:hypothetical protein
MNALLGIIEIFLIGLVKGLLPICAEIPESQL